MKGNVESLSLMLENELPEKLLPLHAPIIVLCKNNSFDVIVNKEGHLVRNKISKEDANTLALHDFFN